MPEKKKTFKDVKHILKRRKVSDFIKLRTTAKKEAVEKDEKSNRKEKHESDSNILRH